jgi:hypothetical protein
MILKLSFVYIFLYFFVFLLCTSACNKPVIAPETIVWEDNTQGIPLSAKENEIYRTLMHADSLPPGVQGELIYDVVLSADSVDPYDSLFTPELEKAFFTANSNPGSWRQYRFNIGIPYKFISNDDLYSIDVITDTPDEFWVEFYKKYPCIRGYWQFSRIAFNTDSTRAILYINGKSGSLCGFSAIYLLTQTSSGWQIKGARRTSVS